MKRLLAGAVAKAATAVAVSAGALMLVWVPVASAAGTLAGPAQVVLPDGVTPLSNGGSQTNFQLRLPGGAHCSGDTASQGFSVYSFIVPSSVDPGTLTFSGDGPSQGFPLIDSSGSPYTAATTAPTTGQIFPSGPPTFNYAPFDISTLPAGTYKIGIECANSAGVADLYFLRTITISASATDPQGFTWAVVPPNDIPESPLAVALPLSALVVAGIGFVVIRRRRQPEAIVA